MSVHGWTTHGYLTSTSQVAAETGCLARVDMYKITHHSNRLNNTWVLITQTHHRKHRPQIKLRRADHHSRPQIKFSAIWAFLHTLLQQLAQEEIEGGATSSLGCGTNGPDQGEDEETFQQFQGLSRGHLQGRTLTVKSYKL